MGTRFLSYALITPAKNEEKFIEETIKSVIKQTKLPYKWVIVNDGSIDMTSDIVNKYRNEHSWIELVELPVRNGRRFDAKIQSFNEGYKRIDLNKIDIIGNIDADISFEKDFFEYLLIKFMEIPRLGVAGAPFVENNRRVYEGKHVDLNHVSGACQLFRKECYKEIGGFVPVKHGGVDWIAVTTARMMGWKTHSFIEKSYNHLRPIGTGNASVIKARFNHGIKDFYLGNMFTWQCLRAFNQGFHKPYILSGLMTLAGYMYAAISGIKKPISKELINFHQKEQFNRMIKIFKNKGE
jgi:glycosyltransferase involved in cell wall biosynthesis